MGDTLHKIIAAIGANQHFAYALVGLISFSESLPVLGAIIPGTTIIVAISALVPSGAIDLWWLLGSAILGAIAGDGFSYWLGLRFRREIAAMWPLYKYPQLIAVGQAAIEKHGGKSILIARFTPAIRAIVPLVAGILGMNPWRFYLVNIVSAFAWAIVHIVPAVLAGASLVLAGAVGGRLLVLVVILLASLWLILYLVRQAVRRGVPRLTNGLARLWHWARQHDNWMSRELLSLLDPRYHEVKGLLLLIGLLVVATATFLGVLEDVVTGDPLVRADQALFNVMQGVRTLWGDRVMVAVTELGDAPVTGAVVAAVALWLLAQRAWRTIAYWLGAVSFATLFVGVIKLILHVPRPIPLYDGASAFAFPSGHAAVTATVYGFLALVVGRELAPRARLVPATLAALLVGLVAFSRLYLGIHWLSDVVAGLTFAIAWVAGLGIVYLSHRPQPLHARGLIPFAGLVFAVIGSLHGLDRFGLDAQRYAVRSVTVRMAAEAWWRDGWAALPARRIDLAGGLDEPITVQWVGSTAELKARLAGQGWQEAPPWTLESALAWLQPGADLSALPVLTRLHDGRPARLILVHPEPPEGGVQRRLIMRLWRSNVVIEGAPRESYRLWLGTVVEQRLYHLGSLLTYGLASRDENAPRAQLQAALAPVRVVDRVAAPDPWGWNGWVLLTHESALSLPMPEKGVEP